jgi:hypothetical protein
MTAVAEPAPPSSSNGLGYASAPTTSTSNLANTSGDLNIRIEFG